MIVQAQERRVALERLSLHYRQWGTQGPPVVLLHGLASSCRTWDLLAPYLASRFKVVAPDQRGHGLSDKPDAGYGFEEVAKDLAQFISALDLERPLLVGHSWGGNVAVHFAALYPQVPRGLVLVDGGFLEPASYPGMTWSRARRELAPPDLRGVTVAELLQRARGWLQGLDWTPELEAILMAQFQVAEDGTVRPCLSRENHMQVVRALWEQRPSQLYTRIPCPVLMVPARHDNVTSGRMADFQAIKERNVATAQARLVRSRTVWMPDSVHDVQLQRPRELAQLILDAFDEGFFGEP